MIPPAMLKILRALTIGCVVERQKVSRAENGNGHRIFIVDPHTGKKEATDPRSVRALMRAGYLTHPCDGDISNPDRWELTAVGAVEYEREVRG